MGILSSPSIDRDNESERAEVNLPYKVAELELEPRMTAEVINQYTDSSQIAGVRKEWS